MDVTVQSTFDHTDEDHTVENGITIRRNLGDIMAQGLLPTWITGPPLVRHIVKR